jgi:ABC-type Fe3+-hydroxamate transport system substrate-binding protein
MTSPSYERIVELEPDIVYVTLPLQRRIKDDLTRLGLRCTDISPESFKDIFESIGEVGVHLGKWAVTDSLVKAFQAELAEETLRRIDPPVTVYLELSDRPLYTVGSKSFLNQVLEGAGARNVFADVSKGYFVPSTEEILERAPEAIVKLHDGVGDYRRRVGWDRVPAVGDKWIVEGLDLDLLSRPGPRFIQAIRSLRSALLDVIEE